MRRRLSCVCAGALTLALMGGTALAAPPAWAQGSRGGQAAGSPASASSTAATPEASFGSQVSAAVHAALLAGSSGTAVGEAVHEVLLAEHANAKGLSVAEAVYGRLDAGTGTPGASPFADLTVQAPWAEAAVDALQKGGVVNGTSSTTFAPGQSVTLAELATMLARLQAGAGTPGTAVPAGTPVWAQDAMAWANGHGVLAGEVGLGTPNAPLTRAQAVLMLINAAGLAQQATVQSGAPIDLQGTPPPWAHGALALAIQLGLLQGSGGQLDADQPLTRAQMAVLLARLAVLEAAAGATTTTTGN